MVLDVALLGTSGMAPLPGRWLASTLVRYGSHLVLFDCGEGTQVSLRALGWGIKALDLILVSHLHADHVGGLPGLLLTQGNAGRTEPVEVLGPPGLTRTVAALRTIARYLPFEVRCREVEEPSTFELDGLRGATHPADHSVPCVAYRLDVPRRPAFDPERAQRLRLPVELWGVLQRGTPVEWDGRAVLPDEVLGPPRRGIAVGLIGDTRPTSTLVEFVRGCDLLVSEAMYGDPGDQARAEERKHMTFAEAAALARDADVGRLVLTHFSPSMTDPSTYAGNATAVFPNTTVGQDHLTVHLRFPDVSDDGR